MSNSIHDARISISDPLVHFDTDDHKQVERYRRLRDEYKIGESLVKQLADTLNGGMSSYVLAGMLNEFCKTHRTLQQSVVRGLLQMLVAWVTDGNSNLMDKDTISDMRNDATYEFAAELSKNMPAFPYI